MVVHPPPPVEDGRPPTAVIAVANPVIRLLSTSPLHRAVSKGLIVLHVRGRRSGRVYHVPVGRHSLDGQLVVSGGGRWKHNLAGGADLDITIDGRRRPAHGVLINDPREVAEVFAALLSQEGLKSATMLGLKINVDRMPTLEELQAALADRSVVRLTLRDQ